MRLLHAAIVRDHVFDQLWRQTEESFFTRLRRGCSAGGGDTGSGAGAGAGAGPSSGIQFMIAITGVAMKPCFLCGYATTVSRTATERRLQYDGLPY
jgi:hypothetical protein